MERSYSFDVGSRGASEGTRGGSRLRVLELFAGIGGMRLALSYAGLHVEVIAVEVNGRALRIYTQNFGAEGVISRDLRSLPSSWFEQQRCQIWTMSPPCQPYTRQGKFRDAEDPRAQPLLHIIQVLKEVTTPPESIVLENVKNFERSESCALLLAALEARGYAWRSFLLSPMQFGFPNARKRFYLVAKQRKWPFTLVPELPCQRDSDGCLSRAPWPCIPCATSACAQDAGSHWARISTSASAIAEDAYTTCTACARSAPSLWHWDSRSCCTYRLAQISEFLDGTSGSTVGSVVEPTPWLVPEAVMQKESARCFDAVNGSCRHSLCFTKAYGRYVNGTGSVYMLPCRMGEPSLVAGEYTMQDFFGFLRYFTPPEVARLLGFKLRSSQELACVDGCLPRCMAHECLPDSESTSLPSLGPGHQSAERLSADPGNCTCVAFGLSEVDMLAEGAREAWALLGNSLNPQVVALVCRLCQLEDIRDSTQTI